MIDAFHSAGDLLLSEARSERRRLEQEEGWRRQADRVEKRIEEAVEADGDLSTVIALVAMEHVSAARLETMQRNLSDHQSATVAALLKNREELDRAEARREELLDQAHKLDDGRRAFRTEDGLRVFDEHGDELNSEEIDPDAIEDWRPSFEVWSAAEGHRLRLMDTRGDLLAYQKSLDEAEDLIAKGNLSEDDFAEIENLLGEQTPASVRAELAQTEPEASFTSAQPAPQSVSVPAPEAGYTEPSFLLR